MIKSRIKIRDCIIPDSSVKLLELCLSEEENEFFLPRTQRKGGSLEFRADWALQSCIKERIQNSKPEILPLVLRKKMLLENFSKTKDIPNKSKKIEELFMDKNVPIIMRKYLLYKQFNSA